MVDKGSNIKSKLPSRHVSVGPKSAPHRSMYYAMGLKKEDIEKKEKKILLYTRDLLWRETLLLREEEE